VGKLFCFSGLFFALGLLFFFAGFASALTLVCFFFPGMAFFLGGLFQEVGSKSVGRSGILLTNYGYFSQYTRE
jgi:hypothetical protein